jgi:hypothetical protein
LSLDLTLIQIENERLDLQYGLLKNVYGGKHYFAPIREPKKILDIGTGTGLWCLDIGERSKLPFASYHFRPGRLNVDRLNER